MNIKQSGFVYKYLKHKSDEFRTQHEVELKKKEETLAAIEKMSNEVKELDKEKKRVFVEGTKSKDTIMVFKMQINDAVMKEMEVPGFMLKIKAVKDLLQKEEANHEELSKRHKELETTTWDMKMAIKLKEKEVEQLDKLFDSAGHTLSLIADKPENQERVENFENGLLALSRLFESYGKELEFDVEVNHTFDNEEKVFFKNLILRCDGKEILFDTQLALIRKEEQYSSGYLMDTDYFWKSGFKIQEAKSVYDFFSFLPKTYVHVEFEYCIEEESHFLTSLFLYQPDQPEERAFLSIRGYAFESTDQQALINYGIEVGFTDIPSRM